MENPSPERETGASIRSRLLWGMLSLGLALLAISQSVRPFPENDLFWQIRTGSEILSGHFPHFDRYSWTCRGHSWIAMEWGSLVCLSLAFKLAGFGGVWLAQAGVAVLLTWVLYGALARFTGSALAGVAGAALFLFGEQDYLQPRPHLFSFLGFALFLGLVRELRARIGTGTKLSRTQWAAPPLLVVIWSNFHPGSALGVALLVALALGDWAQGAARPDSGRKQLATFCLIEAVLCGIATGITPYGWGAYAVSWATVRDANAMSIPGEWLPLRPGLEPDFAVFVLVSLISAVLILWNRRQVSWGAVLVCAALAFEALSHWRNEPLFVLASLLLLPFPVELKPARQMFPAVAAMIVLVPVSLFNSWHRFQDFRVDGSGPLDTLGRTQVALNLYPGLACDFLRDLGLPPGTRLFNDWNYGGYLILAAPQDPVFIDGREDVYLGPLLDGYAHLTATMSAHRPLDAADRKYLTSYPFDVAITSQFPIIDYFYNAPGWTQVYADPQSVAGASGVPHFVFVRETPRYAAFIKRCHQGFKAWAEPYG